MRRSNTLIRLAVDVALTLVIVAMAAWAAFDYLSMPTIYRSYTTRECVKVEGCDCDCDSVLPDRAHLVWVK